MAACYWPSSHCIPVQKIVSVSYILIFFYLYGDTAAWEHNLSPYLSPKIPPHGYYNAMAFVAQSNSLFFYLNEGCWTGAVPSVSSLRLGRDFRLNTLHSHLPWQIPKSPKFLLIRVHNRKSRSLPSQSDERPCPHLNCSKMTNLCYQSTVACISLEIILPPTLPAYVGVSVLSKIYYVMFMLCSYCTSSGVTTGLSQGGQSLDEGGPSLIVGGPIAKIQKKVK